VVKNLLGAGASPVGNLLRPQVLRPAPGEAECGRQQHEALDLRMARGVQCRQIAHAGSHQSYRFGEPCGPACPMSCPLSRAFDYGELAGDGEVFEVGAGQVGDVYASARSLQPVAEIACFA
jgi:hypothetical protein